MSQSGSFPCPRITALSKLSGLNVLKFWCAAGGGRGGFRFEIRAAGRCDLWVTPWRLVAMTLDRFNLKRWLVDTNRRTNPHLNDVQRALSHAYLFQRSRFRLDQCLFRLDVFSEPSLGICPVELQGEVLKGSGPGEKPKARFLLGFVSSAWAPRGPEQKCWASWASVRAQWI